MSAKPVIPYTADLSTYEREASALLDAARQGVSDARWRFKWEHPRFRGEPVESVVAADLGIDDARTVIAREAGFEGWPEVVDFTNRVLARNGDFFEEMVEAVIAGDTAVLRRGLQENPDVVRARSTRRHHATLLHYLAANGVEGFRQRTPRNAVEIARMLLEAGAEVDALAHMYDQQCTTLSMLVSSTPPAEAGLQGALAEILLDYGAALNGPGSKWQSCLMTSLTFGFLETARTLVKRGASVDNLAVAAGLGLRDQAERMLPEADAQTRHMALALAAQLGQVPVLKLLLDAGEAPSRFNPKGFHDHSTPLHQAVWADHMDAVRLLVDRGARLDVPDRLYGSTPLGWAIHGGRAAIAKYLQEIGAVGG